MLIIKTKQMEKEKNIFAFIVAAVLLVGFYTYCSSPVLSQEIRRTELQRYDLEVPGREVIQSRVDFDEGAEFGKHSHPGEEIVYVIEGVFEYQVEGKAPVTLKAGEVLFIPPRTIHAAKNVGKGNAAELATYIVEKGKPLLVMKE